ncbi:ABC transporter permease subunit [Pikeienuella piscinae]|uniref:ABC transporter permease subunit n=1 Tax=Pikeienuella piscinae TaxID=2748098 RepID=A0A7L5BX16_9RHOB|nr:ABC transporter permease subunit [Pikeienuella piscinae]QIE54434.1 ABC transporter permease subunit [Pikeienuella piscinae]
MTVSATARPEHGFRLSQLIYDTRYRSTTIQVVAMFAFMLAVGWVVNNAIQNLEALGKSFSFSFLFSTSGYDVNQRLLEYSSQSTHGRAAILGILNTLVLALVGCITATILGVLAGVARLSKNWIVARLMTVYVEGFRNVPVLLWIIVITAMVNESMPSPRDYRGVETGAFVFTNRGFYFPEALFSHGLGDLDLGLFKVSLDLMAIIAVLAAGIYAAKRIGRAADVKQAETGVRPRVFWYRVAAIFLPTIALLLFLGFHIGYPELAGFNFKGGTFLRDSFIGLWLALSLYTGAFIAENVRAGIQAVSKGQTEAAYALGLRPSRTMKLVILPQAMRVIVPPLISQYLNLTKNTSLAIAVGYMDATGTLGGITLNQTGREMETLLLLMGFYLIISLSISFVMNVYNERMKLRER